MKGIITKWWPTIVAMIICAVLAVLLVGQFARAPSTDTPLPTPSVTPTEVVVPTPSVPAVSVPVTSTPEPAPDIPTPTPPINSGSVSAGADQTIQPDPVKPSPSQEVLDNPSQKPDGTPVKGTPEPVEHDSAITTHAPPPPPSSNGGGLPGFDNVPNLGENHGGIAEGMYESGEKIGIMD